MNNENLFIPRPILKDLLSRTLIVCPAQVTKLNAINMTMITYFIKYSPNCYRECGRCRWLTFYQNENNKSTLWVFPKSNSQRA